MYVPHNHAYSNRRYADEELQKNKYNISSLAKVVAFSVILVVLTIAGLSGLGIVTMQIESTTDNKIEATKQDLQASQAEDVATLKNRIEQLEKSSQQLQTNVADVTTMKNKIEQLEKNIQQLQATHLADVTTLQNKSEQLESTSNQQMSSSANITDSLAMGINSLKDELNKLKDVQENQKASGQLVAFTVNTPYSKLTNQVPLFTNIVLNEGGAYDGFTGLFTCPVKGLYLFTLTLVSAAARTKPVGCQLLQNATSVATVISNEGSLDSASGTFVLHLSVGDVVKPTCTDWAGVGASMPFSLYSGSLITILAD